MKQNPSRAYLQLSAISLSVLDFRRFSPFPYTSPLQAKRARVLIPMLHFSSLQPALTRSRKRHTAPAFPSPSPSFSQRAVYPLPRQLTLRLMARGIFLPEYASERRFLYTRSTMRIYIRDAPAVITPGLRGYIFYSAGESIVADVPYLSLPHRHCCCCCRRKTLSHACSLPARVCICMRLAPPCRLSRTLERTHLSSVSI